MSISAAPPMSLAERVAAIEWYHSIELAPGLVTPGWLDHRRVLDQIPLPASLHGQRCMDVGTFNGFWAFELERRGADQVVAQTKCRKHISNLCSPRLFSSWLRKWATFLLPA